jgi:hypothetical protein
MEELLIRVGSQAASFAIRSGVGYASKFAFVQVSKFIQVLTLHIRIFADDVGNTK